MSLAPGTKLGPYEIVAPLGAGGMGEVYRAKDTRLGREVAIKALPEGFERDAERVARLEREARLLASLNHPNVAGIYGLEEVAGHRYLVLELVEGETLAARLARGALPVDEAIEVCRQVAAGVEAAHENGVVHRDLKPGNVMLTAAGAVKVLDFGLAKASDARATTSGAGLSASPTMTHAATSAGMLLGTAAYMSPEQARGKFVDRRTDVWSFGCVLYECLTGRQAYEGETVSDLIARIIEREPDWSAIPPATPPRVVELLRRCLTKDVTLRLRDIGEARVALGEPGGMATPEAREAGSARRWLAPAVAAALAVSATAAAFLALGPAPSSRPVRQFRIPVEGLTTTFFAPLALARDGRSIAYEAGNRVWIRRMDQLDATEVPGSTRGRAPFWSWDQSTLCFTANRKLWSFTPGGDPPREVCDLPESGEIVGGAWGADGRIVLAVWRGGLYEVAAGGGDVRPLLALDSSTVDFHSPGILPDGHTILLCVHDKGGSNAIAVVEGTPPRLEHVFEDSKAGAVSYSPTGHLLVTREEGEYGGSLWAVPFSAASRKVSGRAFKVLNGVMFAGSSSDGLLAAAEDPPQSVGQMVWRRRDGTSDVAIGEPQQGLAGLSLSPDGGRVAYVAIGDRNADIWVRDLARGTRTRLTSGVEWEGDPAWSADGTRIYYASRAEVGRSRIVAVASDGSGSPDTVGHGLQPAVSPDGKYVACTVDRKGNADLWVIPMGRADQARPFLATAADEIQPSFSPDGRWLVYASDESGRLEIYLRRFPEGDFRTQVSVNGGAWPRWTRRGDGIFYVNGDTLVMVTVGPGDRPALGLPRALFTTTAREFSLSATGRQGYPVDIHPDGSRFIGVRQSATTAPRSLVLVENWLEEFRKR